MKVKFLPQNVEHEIEFNETILHLAQRVDIHIQSVCKGLPSCAECRICIKEGDHNVPPPGSKELSLIGTAYYIDQSRLSCQLRCFGDVTIDVSEQIEKQSRVSKRPQGRGARADHETSHAVKGNIIEDFTELNDVTLVEKLDPREERIGHDNFYKTPDKNRGRSNNNSGGNRNSSRNNRGGGQGARAVTTRAVVQTAQLVAVDSPVRARAGIRNRVATRLTLLAVADPVPADRELVAVGTEIATGTAIETVAVEAVLRGHHPVAARRQGPLVAALNGPTAKNKRGSKSQRPRSFWS